MATLHVHLDESGCLRFDPYGTRHYVFAASWTYNPAPLARSLTALRFRLVKEGLDLASFHAAEDRQTTRDAVVAELVAHESWNFAAIVVDKPRVNPSIRTPDYFYPKFAAMVLRFIFKGRLRQDTERVLIYTDTLPVTKRRAVGIMIKGACRLVLTKPFHAYHHRRESNSWLQVTDYCSWAVFRKWESGDTRTYTQLRHRLAAAELNVMSRGDGTVYYEKRLPPRPPPDDEPPPF